VVSAALSIGAGTSVFSLGSTLALSGAASLSMPDTGDVQTFRTLSIAGGSATLQGSYRITEALTISAGTLVVDVVTVEQMNISAGAVTFRTSARITSSLIQTGGTVTVNSALQLLATNNTMSGGTLTGSGTTTFLNDWALSGGTVSGSRVDVQGGLYLSRSVVITAGNLNSNGNSFISGSLSGSGSAVLKNVGTMLLQSGAQLLGASWTVSNIGTVALREAITIPINPYLNSAGPLNVTSGVLVVQGGAVVTGPINVADSATLRIAGNSQFNAGASVAIAALGTVQFTSGSTSFNVGAAVASSGTMTYSGGSVTYQYVRACWLITFRLS
jgi:hypothetical protein